MVPRMVLSSVQMRGVLASICCISSETGLRLVAVAIHDRKVRIPSFFFSWNVSKRLLFAYVGCYRI